MAGTIVANTINTDTGLFSTNNAYLGIAKAWVQFNGSTSVIAASFNVSSITKIGTAGYRVNFTNAMPDAAYAISGSVCGTAGSYFAGYVGPANSSVVLTTSVEVTSIVFNVSGALSIVDEPVVSVVINR